VVRFRFGRNFIGGATPLSYQRNLLDGESGIVERIDRLFGQIVIVKHPDDRMVTSSARFV
jgi:hypothetical protein